MTKVMQLETRDDFALWYGGTIWVRYNGHCSTTNHRSIVHYSYTYDYSAREQYYGFGYFGCEVWRLRHDFCADHMLVGNSITMVL